jgi:hypothetical protein
MTEVNPPAQPDKKELRRRILLYLKEAQRRVDYPYLSDIAKDLGETPEDIKDQLDILKCLEEIEVKYFTNRDALPFITGKGKLKLEKMAQTAPQPDSPPSSETSPEPQEFDQSPDYASVNWLGQQYQFNKNQATCVRLLHEAWLEGTPYLSGDYLLREIESASKMSDLFKRHPAWGSLIVPGERRATYRLKLSPKLPPNSP